jgi:hypothetical protein
MSAERCLQETDALKASLLAMTGFVGDGGWPIQTSAALSFAMFEGWALMVPMRSVVQVSLRDAVGILVGAVLSVVPPGPTRALRKRPAARIPEGWLTIARRFNAG